MQTMLLGNTHVQAESFLLSQEQVARRIDLNMKAILTMFMDFKQKGAIFAPKGSLLKLVGLLTYLGSNNSSTESNVKIFIVKS